MIVASPHHQSHHGTAQTARMRPTDFAAKIFGEPNRHARTRDERRRTDTQKRMVTELLCRGSVRDVVGLTVVVNAREGSGRSGIFSALALVQTNERKMRTRAETQRHLIYVHNVRTYVRKKYRGLPFTRSRSIDRSSESSGK